MDEKKELKTKDIKAAAEITATCPVAKSLYYMTEFLNGPMCGKCLPCALGSYEARIRLQTIVEGRGGEADVFSVRRIALEMLEGSLCKKGKDTARFILEWMETWIFMEHIEGRCPAMECHAFVEYQIVPDKCTLCGLCKGSCYYGAILGEKRKPYLSGYFPFEIRQKRCTKCGDCIKVCPEGAVVVIAKKVEAEVKV